MKNRFPAFSTTAVALACAVAMLPAKAANVIWIGPNASFWDLAANWNPALPGAADDVLLSAFNTTFRSGAVTIQSFTGTGTLSVTGGSLSTTAASSTGGLNLSAGTIGGSGNVGIAGTWNWTGGVMTGTGSTFANDTVNITGTATKQISGNRIVNLAGTTTWGGNTVDNNNVLQFAGGTLNNNGTFNDQNGFASFIDSAGGTNAFNNVGTYNKQSNTVTTVEVFNNTGTTNVNAGTMLMQGTSTTTGTFNLAAGTTLEFRNGSHALNGATTSGGGTLVVSTDNVGADALVTINGGTLNSAFLLSGSVLNGTDHTFQGPATWTGGTITGAATASTTFGSTLAISGPGSKTLSGGRSVNAGNTTWSGNTAVNNNAINISGASAFNNTGSFTDANTFDSTINVGNGGGMFNNNGVFNKQSNTTTSVGTQFNSTGTVNVNAGTMLMQGGGTDSGLFNIANGAMLEFRNGSHTLNNVATSGAGTLVVSTDNVGADAVVAINGGTHTTPFLLSGSILTGTDHTFQGGATWTGGTITGAATASTTFGSTLAISGPGSKTLSGGRSVNAGNTTWSGNTVANNNSINISGASAFNNTGSFTDANTFDSTINVGNGGGSFNNNGVFNKLSNTTTSIGTQYNGTGTANVNAGTMLMQGGGTSSGVFNIANGAMLEFRNGNHTLNNVTTSGAGILQISTENVGADATVAINGGTHTTPFILSGSTLAGTDNIFKGPVSWTGGTIAGAASTTFDNNVSISGLNPKTLLGGRTLNLNATTTWGGNTADNNNAIRFWNGATINNNGTFNDVNQFASFLEHVVGGPHNFNNNGTYNKQANTLTTVDLGVAFNNAGTLNIDAGTMRFSSGSKGPTGTVKVASGATFQQDAASTAGNLITAGTLVLGTQTLTVHLDYDNANFGVGNAFNRRANVNVTAGGAAQRLLAAGDANQGVTGVGITNGTSANPVLTIGNVHVGANSFAYNIINTGSTGPALRGAIQTSVNGANLTDTRLSGNGVSAGNWGPLATGASLTRDVVVTVDTAGVFTPLSGQAVAIVNNFENTRGQLLTLSSSAGAAAYRLASASTIGAVNFGAVHVGDTVTQALTVSNTAINDGFSERLNGSFGGSSDARITTSGSFSQLGAGATSNSSLIVGLNTAAAGTVNGTVTVNLQSDGTGTSGLGITALPSQAVGVSGVIATASVFRLANPVINTVQPVDFGNLRIGASASQALSITNNVPNDGFSEKLNGAAGSTTGGVTVSGAFNLLGAGATDTTGIVVGINTATAGNKSGTATIGFVSDGAGTSGLGQTTLASQNVNVNGDVFRVAQPTLNTGSINLASRVGGNTSQAISVTNSAPADGFSEGLKASPGTAPTGFTTSGSIANLAAGATSNSALQVGLVTSAAGSFAGSVGVNLTSTGAGTSGLADLALAGQSVSVTGKVYTPAIGSVNTANLNFGVVHKGDVVTLQGVSVSNGAAVTALNDTLHADFGAVSGPFSGTGSISGLAAGGTDNASLKVGLNTASAGVFTGTGIVNLASHDADLADIALASGSVTLAATVNNFAELSVGKTGGSGSLSKAGNTYTLDFGTLALGGADLSGTLIVFNSATGPADLLRGSFDTSGVGPGFLLDGFTPFANIAAGSSQGSFSITFDSATLGAFENIIVLHSFGSNASGFDGALTDTTLVLRGDVLAVAVPEPGTYLLMLGGVVLLLVRKRRAMAI